MDIRRLSIFLEVVEQGGFTRAADVLLCSQPAVSQAIGQLEAELGTPLFLRIGRRVELTAAGRALVAPARRIQRDLVAAGTAVREVVGLEAGELDIACLPTLAAAPLAPLIGAFRRAHPGIVVRLAAPDDTCALHDLVRSGRSELGIVDDRPATGLVSHDLGRQDFLVVFPPGRGPKAVGPAHSTLAGRLRLEDLDGVPVVAPPPGTSSRTLLDEAFRVAGISPHLGVEASQREAILPLILAGAGIGLLPRPLAELAERLGCTIAEPVPRRSRDVVLVHREGPLTPAAGRFVQLACAPDSA